MKKIIALSTAAILSTALYADADMQAQLDALTAKIEKLEKQNKRQNETISEVKVQSAKDNIKFDVDFRTAYDNLQYKTASGETLKNDALFSNRLWLNMGYAPTETMLFKGQLAYHKAFGAAALQPNTYPQRGMGFDTFDWISSETLNDDKIRVREAYWLWTPKLDDVSFTVSVGRRPSTNGFMANLREDDAHDKSPNGHVINMEFDGASAGIKSDALLPGMLFKLCLGRGLTNAKSWANEADYTQANGMGPTSPNYIEDKDALDTVDMAGFIFIPYDDGQYALKTTWYRGLNVPGMLLTDYDFSGTPMDSSDDVQSWAMQSVGDMDGMAISLKIDGIGNEISDFLDDTSFFASYARSVTHPNGDAIRTANANMAAGMLGLPSDSGMLGSADSETGSSIWIGAVMPNLTGGKFGLEYNKGSKYWRPFTYGEDTMIGSKIAARGSAYEAYWSQPLGEAFSMQVRYTYIDYDYTGSNAFFGDGGTPMTMAEAQAAGMDPVETASDLRVYFRYRY
jgi:hypothetical protein